MRKVLWIKWKNKSSKTLCTLYTLVEYTLKNSASSLQATNGRRAVGNTNRLKAVSPSFVCQLRTQTAQSDGTTSSFDARFLAAVAARVPSSNST